MHYQIVKFCIICSNNYRYRDSLESENHRENNQEKKQRTITLQEAIEKSRISNNLLAPE